MLENYIIEQIQSEREAEERRRIPLHIQVPGDYGMEQAPAPLAREPEVAEQEKTDWGAVVIDFSI